MFTKTKIRRNPSPNSLANLIPAKKGEVRNPHGRPSKFNSLLDCINTELGKLSVNGVSTNMEIIAAILVDKATKGSDKAIELILAYKHAKPTQGIDLNLTEKPLSIIFQAVEGRKE